jgi:Flp pilus assembly pilin Flp
MFANLVIGARNFLGTFHKDTRAQDAFEYLLVVGGVSVAIVVAMTTAPGLTDALVDGVCNAIDGVVDVGDC